MYRCLNCGEVFGDPGSVTETHGFTDGSAETFYVCPFCKGDYEEVHKCRACRNWYTEDELHECMCESCLYETINYDTFFEYCEANKNENYLDTFVMCYLLNCDEVPKYPSLDFHKLMIDAYKERVKEIKSALTEEYRKCIDILPSCIRFIMDDDGSIGRENYADWLNSKKEVK